MTASASDPTDKPDEKTEQDIYSDFSSKIAPVVFDAEHRFPQNPPIEIYNEARAILTHLTRIKTQDLSDVDRAQEVRRAYRHIERGILDIYKYSCICIRDYTNDFLDPYNKLAIHMLDNGRFLSEVSDRYYKANSQLLAAKIDDTSKRRKTAIAGYGEALSRHIELYNYVHQFEKKIAFLKLKAFGAQVKAHFLLILALISFAIMIIGFCYE